MENPYPHKPDLAYLYAMRGRLTEFLEASAHDRPREEGHRNGAFFRIAGTQALNVAVLDASRGEPASRVVPLLRAGLADILHAYELGEPAVPDEVRSDLGCALAVDDRDAVRFLVTLPEQAWGFPALGPDRIPAWIARTEMNLVRDEPREVEIALDVLAGLIHDRPVPRDDEDEDPPDPKPGFDVLHKLLEAVLKRDGAAAARFLARRQEIRAADLAAVAGHRPLDLVDFEGLGLCRLLSDRGVRVDVASVYLPAALLPNRA